MTTFTPPPPLHHFTTHQFQDALTRHVDEAKPNPLLKTQLANLRVEWQQREPGGDQGDQRHENSVKIYNSARKSSNSNRIFGTLTISSEYISIAVHVKCLWRVGDVDSQASVSKVVPNETHKKGSNIVYELNSDFHNEFYFRLGVTASCVRFNEYNQGLDKSVVAIEDAKCQKMTRKERSVSHKLRSDMIKRLRADPLIRLLLVDEVEAAATSDGVLVCEALIQQNETNNHESNTKCEERVNVNSESIEGIKNAILSQTEENLDVLEMLLNMPYLPRDGFAREDQNESPCGKRNDIMLRQLSGRAFLRILEDAMFDACEKEGEDEMLDDLNITDDASEQGLQATTRKPQSNQSNKKKRKS